MLITLMPGTISSHGQYGAILSISSGILQNNRNSSVPIERWFIQFQKFDCFTIYDNKFDIIRCIFHLQSRQYSRLFRVVLYIHHRIDLCGLFSFISKSDDTFFRIDGRIRSVHCEKWVKVIFNKFFTNMENKNSEFNQRPLARIAFEAFFTIFVNKSKITGRKAIIAKLSDFSFSFSFGFFIFERHDFVWIHFCCLYLLRKIDLFIPKTLFGRA